MSRTKSSRLPKYLELHPANRCFYYKNPSMQTKANLGRQLSEAIELANTLNEQYQRRAEREGMIARVASHVDSVHFDQAFGEFVEKYIQDYRLKSSTARLLRQRCGRLVEILRGVPLILMDTPTLREAIASFSQFEQSKQKTLLNRFFSYAISNGTYPAHLSNPVTQLYVDPVPPKRRQRITIEQFRAIYGDSPDWLQWLLTLAFHLALRRVDLVNLRFEDVHGDRIVSPIRKTDSDARGLESTSVDFPMHPDVQSVVAQSRESSMANGRCPFIVHRTPGRRTKRAADAVRNGSMIHPAQVLPEYASKAFNKARAIAAARTGLFDGMKPGDLPTLHEIRSLSSHLYALAGYDVDAVQQREPSTVSCRMQLREFF